MFNSNDKDKQAELFGSLSDMPGKPKKTRFNLGKIAVSLSYENILILSIGLIMLLIVCYSLGVERGKNLAQLIPLHPDTLTDTSGQKRAEETEDIAVEPQRMQEAPKKSSPPKPQKKRVKVKFAQDQPREALPYIQVASFLSDKYAKKENDQLKNKGYRSFVTRWGKYRVVCVGKYNNKEEANRDLMQLKKLYADCILHSK